jgi:hypothetical protein
MFATHLVMHDFFEVRGYVVQDQIPYAVLVSQSHSLRR